jgi:hypothetical protein
VTLAESNVIVYSVIVSSRDGRTKLRKPKANGQEPMFCHLLIA